jgi:uncharacterized protein
MIHRDNHLNRLDALLSRHKIVGIVGARQVGKTTLAQDLARQRGDAGMYFDLEKAEDLARLQEPELALKDLEGLVIIDEVQRRSGLFEALRVLADRKRYSTRFLILGSASPDMLRQSSETLAGRIVYHELGGFTLDEIGTANHTRLWLRGGFPRSYLARTHAASHEWRQGFVRTFLERDLPQLGVTIRAPALRRFWTMLAHYHGQIWNASEFARSFGVADTTVRNYLDLLTSALVVRQLLPWHENISKRQVKAPKVFIHDSGLLHALLNLRTMADLEGHPKAGASWEGFLLNEVVRRLGAEPEECFFWATHAGAELDLLVVRGNVRLGFEIKRTTAPKVTRSMRTAMSDLQLRELTVIHAGEHSFALGERMRAVAVTRIMEDIEPLLR